MLGLVTQIVSIAGADASPEAYADVLAELKVLRFASLRLLQQVLRLARCQVHMHAYGPLPRTSQITQDIQSIRSAQADDEVAVAIFDVQNRMLASQNVMSRIARTSLRRLDSVTVRLQSIHSTVLFQFHIQPPLATQTVSRD